MNMDDLIKKIQELEKKIGMWQVEIGCLSDADFVIGYGYDETKELWKVFENGEKGSKLEWYFDSEQDALLKLYKKVKFQSKILN